MAGDAKPIASPTRRARGLMKTWLLFAVLVSGCSSDDDGSAATNGASVTACAADMRKDLYAAGMTKPAGTLVVKLVEAVPAPPIKGMNVLTVNITDGGGAPLDGATLTLVPFMPDHAHGSARKPLVTASGGGTYTITDIWLPMAGLWKLTITVQSNGATSEAAFQFCVDG
jgi:hypothetical protein